MVVFLAGAMLVLVGMAGLAIDFGFSTLERRVLQNAVDAAASTGAANLAQGESPTADVSTIVSRNGVATTAIAECNYIDNSGAVTGTCASTPASTTGGVRVTATNLRPTYFMKLLGIPQVTVSAMGAARVFGVSSSSPELNSNALFIVCGINTRRAVSGNQTRSILVRDADGNWTVDSTIPSTMEFVIHNPQVADCGMQSNAFKGLNATGAESGPISLPRNLITETGTRAGPTTEAVRGVSGCAAGVTSDNVNNCVMIIPVFDTAPDKDIAHAVLWVPFYVRQIDSNTHYGSIMHGYTVAQKSYTLLAPWTKNTKQVLTTYRLWN